MASPEGSDGATQQQTGAHFSGSSPSSSSRDTNSEEKLPCAEAMEPTRLTVVLLEQITNNFSKERLLGQGGYGKVYRGVHDGQDIAVKLLDDRMPTIDDVPFIHEFKNLMMLKHPNIVRLVGYCYETQREHVDIQGTIVFGEKTHKALCFEYMPKGSLEKHLSDECSGLDWQPRYKIIKGACEGLKYLHEDLENPFFHLDLKPDNILLDENMGAKLADFGLSKFCGDEQTRMTQSRIGTFGYMPLEYLSRGVVSNKFDIFSLGVVMTKIIAGPKGPTIQDEMKQEFLDHVQGNWRKRLQTILSSPEPLEAQCKQVKTCTEIALRCMETDRHKRPSIVDIIHELNKTEKIMEITYHEQEPSALPASNSNFAYYEQEPSAPPSFNSNFMEKVTYHEQEPSAPPASNSNFMEMVTYYEQEPSAPPASTSNVVQPAVSAPPSTPSPPPSYIGSSTQRQRPPPMSSFVMPPPLPPPPPPSGGFTEFFRTFIQRKPKNNGLIRRFTYRELVSATRDFAEIQELREGAFVVIYKGIVMLQEKHMEGREKEVSVAIKRNIHDNSDEARAAFNNEIEIMGLLNHRNIIRLMGWCNDRNNLFLVYELAEDLNLEARLYGSGTSPASSLVLDWRQRYNILVGIASGLDYLHNKCAKTVLHRDVKPGNVMLDRDFNAKLCDFGLVTQLTHAVTSRSTWNIIGTPDYMDPAYRHTGKMTRECDVYSFGVLLLEVVCGVPPILIDNDGKNSLVEMVWACEGRNAILDAANRQLRGEFDDEIKGVLSIGLRCVHAGRGDRPSMQIVLAQLVGTSHNRHTGRVYADVSPKTRNTGHVREFSYRELATATRSFADTRKLGQGAFGVVYRGTVMMQGKEVDVAIKTVLVVSDEARAAFKNEVEIMSPLNHRNIIRLVGSCDEKDNLLLVYELVQNRNLQARLYDHGGLVLDWCQRYNILVGIASGLGYLHNNCSRTVLHGDIKPAHVMLDMDFNAKLCDFNSTNNIIGTPGYMDPLLFQQDGQVTKDSDVYSFGVLLLEVVCGEEPILIGNPLKNSLIENVRECHGRSAILDAADKRLRGKYDEEIKGALLIGLHCVETRRSDRPTTRIVLSNLVNLTASHVVM